MFKVLVFPLQTLTLPFFTPFFVNLPDAEFAIDF